MTSCFMFKKKCKITIAANTKGRQKWSIKNRDNVGDLTEYPPQIQITIYFK